MVKVMPWLAGAVLLFSVPASAQNFLLNSAETINRQLQDRRLPDGPVR